MQPKESSVLSGASSQEPTVVNDQPSEGSSQPYNSIPSLMLPEDLPNPPAPSLPDPGTVDTVYKIVYADRQEYLLNGKVYFRYNIPPERNSTGWFCIVAFRWHDVQADLECVYHPSIKLFDDFRPVKGSLSGGSGGVQSVQISMWNFVDRGPDMNPKHTVKDDNGNRIMLAVLMMGNGSAVRLHGKMIREGEDEKEVWLSSDERIRLGLRS